MCAQIKETGTPKIKLDRYLIEEIIFRLVKNFKICRRAKWLLSL